MTQQPKSLREKPPILRLTAPEVLAPAWIPACRD